MKDDEKTKEQQITLNQVEQFLSLVTTSTTLALYTCKAGGDFGATYMSNNISAITGYNPEDFTSNSSFWINNIHPDDKQRVIENLSNIFEKGVHKHEYRWRVADGSYKWFYDVLNLIKLPGGENQIIGTFIDISEQKRIEAILRESEQKYRALFEQAADSIVVINTDGRIEKFNDKACENLGYTREEFQKLKLKDIEAIETREEIDEHIKKIIKEGSDAFETKQRRKDGQLRDILVISRVIKVDGKEYIQSIWRDITERKLVEEALKESEEHFRMLSDATTEGVAITEKGKFLDINKRFAEIFGYEPSEIIGMHVTKLVAPEYCPARHFRNNYFEFKVSPTRFLSL